MACLSAGDYTVNVTAPGLEKASQSAHVTDGQELVLMFPMSVKSGNGGGGCMGGSIDILGSGHGDSPYGNLLIFALLLIVLACSQRKSIVKHS